MMEMITKKLLVVTLVIALTSIVTDTGHTQMSSTSYTITTSVFSGGGAPMSSGSYDMNGTIGQPSPLETNPPAGDFTYDLYPGFWYTLDAPPGGCRWDIEPGLGDGDVDGSDLADFSDYSFNELELEEFARAFGRNDCP